MAERCGGGSDGREDGTVEALLQWQKASDFLIGASYLSIPLELLHFATCADLAPLRWVLLQFGAFIVFCGLTHLLAVFTYDRSNSRRLLLAFTAAKVLVALSSFAAAISLPTFIPQLLRLKIREALLRDKAQQLDRDLTLVRRREETAARVVRAFTQHIRGGSLLDSHAILRSAMLYLFDALGLRSCAVWMPADNDGSGVLHLVHQLPPDHQATPTTTAQAIRISDPDVAGIMASKDAKVLRSGSALGTTSDHGAAAAMRMPILRVSNFAVDGSSSESDEQGAVSYAILVLVLPVPVPPPNSHRSRHLGGGWSRQELEIVEAVSDQVAVAVSHAAVLEEWQLTRYKLAERQRALVQARHDAAVATRARDAAHGAMRDGVLRPMHAVLGLLSVMQAQHQDEVLSCAEQRLAVGAMARTSALSSTLMDDVMAALLTPPPSPGDQPVSAAAGVSLVARRPFDLRALVREAACVAGCLARCRGLGFSHRAETSSLPDWVVGDDKRVFHLLLHMLGALLDRCECQCRCQCHDLSFSVVTVVVGEEETMSDHRDWTIPNFSGCNTVCVRFQFGITRLSRDSSLHSSSPRPHDRVRNSLCSSSVSYETRLSIATCNKIVQMMNGKMWRESPSDSEGQHGESVNLILHFQLGFGVASPTAASAASGGGGGLYRMGGGFGAPSPSSSTTAPAQYHFNGLGILLADSNDTTREVTRKLLERLGCQVLPVPSAAHCLSLLLGGGAADQPLFQLQLQVVLLDLYTPAGGADAAGATDDGFEVALRIRKLTSDSFSWLIILVALPLPPRASCVDVRDRCQRAGVNGVIHKPATLPALGAQLYRVLHDDN